MAMKCILIGHCGTSCVKCLHHIKYCSVIVFVFLLLHWVNIDKYLQRKESHAICHSDSTENRIVIERLVMGGCLCLFVTLYKY